MIDDKKILGLIPARGGSKSVPRKNIRPLCGKPLIAWTIEEAGKSRYLDRVILSSEDREIIDTANRYGCETPFVRPMELAQDDTPGVDPILHAITEIPGYDYVLLLQPTSPLRTAEDIDGCIETCVRGGAFSCVSVVKAAKPPYWMYTRRPDGRIEPFVKDGPVYTRRQDMPDVFVSNGALFMAKTGELLKTGTVYTDDTLAYVMTEEHSVDLDSELEFILAETLLSRRLSEKGESR